MEPFRPKVINSKVVRQGRRYGLVHGSASYLVIDTKDPNSTGEHFSASDRARALQRYRDLEAGAWARRMIGRVPRHRLPFVLTWPSWRRPESVPSHLIGPPSRRIRDARSRWIQRRAWTFRYHRALLQDVGVTAVGALLAGILVVFLLGSLRADDVGSVAHFDVDAAAASTNRLSTDGSGDPPRGEVETRIQARTLMNQRPERDRPRDEGGRGDGRAGAGSGVFGYEGGSGSSTSSTEGTSAGDSGSGSGDSGGSGSGDSGSVDQGGGSSDDTGGGPGGAGPGGVSVGGGGGGGSGGGGGGGGGG
jgi:hypothetical protein